MSGQFPNQHYEQYPVPMPVVYAPVSVPFTDREEPNTAVVVVAWIVAVFGSFYLLPWAIAATRGKANRWGVFWVNLLLGWTVVGWIAALVMACTRHRNLYPAVQLAPYAPVAALPPAGPPPGWYPSPNPDGSRYWDGHAWATHYR